MPVSRRFQFWLFAVTFSILALNLLFSFAVQTQTAEQAGQDTISSVSEDIRQAYHRLRQTETGTKVLTEETVMTAVQAIAETVESSGGAAAADASVLERMMHIFDLEAVAALNADGQTVASAGRSELLDGIWNVQVTRPYSQKYIDRAIILHYFNARQNNVYLLGRMHEQEQVPDNRTVQAIIASPREAFLPNQYLVLDGVTEEVMFSKSVTAMKYLYQRHLQVYKAVNCTLSLLYRLLGGGKTKE